MNEEVNNIEYDRIHFEMVGEELVTHDNLVIEEDLTEEDSVQLASEGFLIRQIDETNYWVISARLDRDGLMAGVDELYSRV